MLGTSWPKGAALPRKAKRRKRPPSKAVKAERRANLDRSQLAGRGEYAAKVFSWAQHEASMATIEAATFAEEPTPVVPVLPECIMPQADRDAETSHVFRTLRDSPRVNPARVQIKTKF